MVPVTYSTTVNPLLSNDTDFDCLVTINLKCPLRTFSCSFATLEVYFMSLSNTYPLNIFSFGIVDCSYTSLLGLEKFYV